MLRLPGRFTCGETPLGRLVLVPAVGPVAGGLLVQVRQAAVSAGVNCNRLRQELAQAKNIYQEQLS